MNAVTLGEWKFEPSSSIWTTLSSTIQHQSELGWALSLNTLGRSVRNS